ESKLGCALHLSFATDGPECAFCIGRVGDPGGVTHLVGKLKHTPGICGPLSRSCADPSRCQAPSDSAHRLRKIAASHAVHDESAKGIDAIPEGPDGFAGMRVQSQLSIGKGPK